jgi:hypothetical protein
MNREIKFKGKLENYYGVIDKDWITFELFDIFNYNDSLSKTIVAHPLCQLITKIGDVEIYEYDCYYYESLASYLYYNHKGILTVRFINYETNDFIIPDCEASEDDLIYKDFDKFSFIGNWHDGEEYLLKKIKEVENE